MAGKPPGNGKESVSYDEELMRRYLLGDVGGPQRRRVEASLLSDHAYLECFRIVEEELIDSYLDGELSADDAKRFEDYFLMEPGRRQSLSFALALKTYIKEHTSGSAGCWFRRLRRSNLS
jgi:hypothetical protein